MPAPARRCKALPCCPIQAPAHARASAKSGRPLRPAKAAAAGTTSHRACRTQTRRQFQQQCAAPATGLTRQSTGPWPALRHRSSLHLLRPRPVTSALCSTIRVLRLRGGWRRRPNLGRRLRHARVPKSLAFRAVRYIGFAALSAVPKVFGKVAQALDSRARRLLGLRGAGVLPRPPVPLHGVVCIGAVRQPLEPLRGLLQALALARAVEAFEGIAV